jgi:hypothetical protein
MSLHFLTNLFELVFDRWAGAIIPWIKRLPLLAQTNLLFVGIISGVSWEYHDALSPWTSLDGRILRVVLSEASKPPIATELRDNLNRDIKNRTEQLFAQLNKHYQQVNDNGEYAFSAWTTAEIIVALKDRAVDADKTVAYFNRTRGPGSKEFGAESSFVWSKYQTPRYPPHLDVTSWVVLALAQVDRLVDPQVLDFILSAQKSAGWWPVYPSSGDAWNASTDATAMAILALKEELAAGNQYKRAEIAAAISNGAQWLYSQQVANAARWKDYPNGRPMLSISGLVLHALHTANCFDSKTNCFDLAAIDRLWLRTLPNKVPRATDDDISGRTVFGGPNQPIQTDDIRYYPLPDAVMATIDAYPSGSVFERAFALFWLERVLETRPLEKLKGDADDNWILAVNLIALKML